MPGEAIPPDYDERPHRFRTARSVQREQGAVADIHAEVARAVAAPSRFDSPELAFALPGERLTFDAEVAPGLVAERFPEVEVRRWDAPLLRLPHRAAVRDYVLGKGVAPERAAAAAAGVEVPLHVTKRGALVFARRT